MYKIAVLGDRDSIFGFAALGLDIYPVEELQEAANTLKELAKGTYAVIYITEKLASELAKQIEAYDKEELPAIIPIPGVNSNTGIGIRNVKRMVEQAVGSDIIFNNEKESSR